MSKVIAYTHTDGTARVVHPVWNSQKPGETEQQFLDRVAAKVVPQATAFEIVEHTTLPDRVYRNAWRRSGAAVDVDMPEAREIAKARIRLVRTPIFASFDEKYLRADEQGNAAEKARVASQKQKLRDAPDDNRIANAPNATALLAAENAIANELKALT